MCTRLAPTYTNLFMSDFKDKHTYTYPKQPLLWICFIDDILYVWPHGPHELERFINHLNGVHTTIKYMSESSTNQVNF